LWYDFATLKGGTVYDLSGYGNHGTLYGPVWRRGPLIGALSFDGVDDYVEVPDSPSLDITRKITIEALVLTRVHAEKMIINKENWEVPERNYRLQILSDGRFEFSFYDGGWRLYESNSIVPLNTLVYLAAAFDEDTDEVKLYMNGELDVVLSSPYSLIPNVHPLLIGDSLPRGWVWDGIIAHVRLYSRVLTEREIKAHHRYLSQRFVMHPSLVL